MSPGQQAQSERYGNAWSAIVQLVRDGFSWSGSERNRLLLNRGDGRFTDISAVSGLDHDGDGRAMAMVDWDADGDLDLWFRDRTAPRLRFMRNHHATGDRDDYVALKLEGTTSNRNGIGAAVEVLLDGTSDRLTKSVRAGDLFLSQSSHWLHFGLGDGGEVKSVRVLWPGGEQEDFHGVKRGGAFLLKQGIGQATIVSRQGRAKLVGAPQPAEGATDRSARILLPARIPLPPTGYRGPDGQMAAVGGSGMPTLVVLWSADCLHCRRDLPALGESAGSLRAAGLPLVLALNVDGAAGGAEAAAMMERIGWPFAWGMIEPEALERINELQRALFDLSVPLSVPLAVLCDREGNVAALYRGKLEARAVIDDWKTLDGAGEDDLHALAPPLGGRWFTKPVDPVFAVEFVARQFEARLPEDALHYLGAAWERESGPRRVVLGEELARKHHGYALGYKRERKPGLAAAHFERSLEVDPTAEVFLNYGTMLASYGQLAEAEEKLLDALGLDPKLVPAQKALALVRKLRSEGN